MADSDTGYTWNFFVCTGKSEVSTTYGLSYSAVMDLLPLLLLGQGYILYVDNTQALHKLFFVELYQKRNKLAVVAQLEFNLF